MLMYILLWINSYLDTFQVTKNSIIEILLTIPMHLNIFLQLTWCLSKKNMPIRWKKNCWYADDILSMTWSHVSYSFLSQNKESIFTEM